MDLDILQKQHAITFSRPCLISAEQLFRTGCEIVIAHKGVENRLQIIRNEKLILTK